MTTRNRGRFARSPQTFAKRVEAEIWADLKAQTAEAHATQWSSYQHRAAYLTDAFDRAAERLVALASVA